MNARAWSWRYRRFVNSAKRLGGGKSFLRNYFTLVSVHIYAIDQFHWYCRHTRDLYPNQVVM